MLCDRCNKEEASIHIRGTDQHGNIHALNLCSSCAIRELSDENIAPEAFLEAFRLTSFSSHLNLLKALNEIVRKAEGSRAFGEDEGTDEKCPQCGLKNQDLRQNLLLGCPECLKTFAKELSFYLDLTPDFSFFELFNSASAVDDDISVGKGQASFRLLNARLQAAVQAEKYELAAVLKEELANMQKQLVKPVQTGSHYAWGKHRVVDEFARAEQIHANLPWLPKKRGERALVRLSSLFFLSRNLSSYAFPPFTKQLEQAEEICSLLSPFLQHDALMEGAREYIPQAMDKADRLELTERGWCPHDFVFRNHATSVLISENERVIALLNNIDHLRLNLWGEADDLPEMIKQASDFAKRLESRFELQRDQQLGYISRHLNSLGSGAGIGQLLHLPGLSQINQLEKVVQACNELKFQLRPLFNKTDLSGGAFYILQSSNSMNDLFSHAKELLDLSRTVAEKELQSREIIQSDKGLRLRISDLVGRAVGSIRGMRLVSLEEAESLLSTLWLGLEMDMLPWLEMGQIIQKVTELLIAPAQLAASENLRKDHYQLQIEMAKAFRKDLLRIEEIE